MKSSIFPIILLLLFVFGANAQTTISGIVTDTSYSPIPFASVYLSKTTVGVAANNEGIYSLSVPQDGNYELISSCVGYKH